MVSTSLSSIPPASSARTSPLHLTSSDVNRLLYCYLLESNLVHSAFTFSLEAKLASLPETSRNIPRGELLRWLHRGLAWKEVEHHVEQAEEAFGSPVPPCSAAFDLINPHVCVPVGPTTPSPSSSRILLPSTQQPITLPLGTTSTLAAPPPPQRAELLPEPPSAEEELATVAAAATVGSSTAKGKRKAVNGAGDKNGDLDDEAGSVDGKGASSRKEGASSGGGASSSKRPRVDKEKKEEAETDSSKSAKVPAPVAVPKPAPLPSFQRKTASTHPLNPNRPTSSSSSTSSSKPASPSTTFQPLPNPSAPSTSTPNLNSNSNPSAAAPPKKSTNSATTSPVLPSRPLAPSSASGTSTSKKKKKPSSSTSNSSLSSSLPAFVDKAPGEDYTQSIRTVSVSLEAGGADAGSSVDEGGKKTGKGKDAKGKGKVRIFSGEHTGEVFVCKFSPVQQSGGGEVLATGAGDATVRLWEFQPPGASGSSDPEGWSLEEQPTVCKHLPVTDRKDVTSIDFNPPGTLIGTASYDGIARLWTAEGELHGVLTRHSGAIFCLKFNPTGSLLATAGSDGSVCVWDSDSARLRQAYEFHSDCTLDVDWLDDETLASCSMDKTITVCRVGSSTPFRTFRGHSDEVNRVAWSPAPANSTGASSSNAGRVLASCSDDATVRIWSLDAEPAPPTSDDGPSFQNGRLEKYCKGVLRGHEKEIYTFAFAPTTVGSSSAIPILATASFDQTVRLWDISSLTCLRVLRAHTETVFSISFSPSGRHLASAGWDKLMVIWETETGKPVRHRAGEAGIFELEWSKNAGVVAVCQSDRAVVLVDVKELE